MKYAIQRGMEKAFDARRPDEPQGHAPKLTDQLPRDVPALEPGDWKYSDVLGAWIG